MQQQHHHSEWRGDSWMQDYEADQAFQWQYGSGWNSWDQAAQYSSYGDMQAQMQQSAKLLQALGRPPVCSMPNPSFASAPSAALGNVDFVSPLFVQQMYDGYTCEDEDAKNGNNWTKTASFNEDDDSSNNTYMVRNGFVHLPDGKQETSMRRTEQTSKEKRTQSCHPRMEKEEGAQVWNNVDILEPVLDSPEREEEDGADDSDEGKEDGANDCDQDKKDGVDDSDQEKACLDDSLCPSDV